MSMSIINTNSFVGTSYFMLFPFEPKIVLFDQWEIQFNKVVNRLMLREADKARFLITKLEYHVFHNLSNQTYPINPKTLSYEEIVSILRNTYNDIPDNYALILKLFTRLQMENESIRDFYFALEILAELCDLGDDTNKMLRKQFIVGLKNKTIRDRLLMMDDKDLEDIVSIAYEIKYAENL
ncbi:hypothetical protein M0802_011158 [Mischocyttarus mexicanus]|nr:hypothetical protein M0802_011158 [Mischocyttarus mexicanus]